MPHPAYSAASSHAHSRLGSSRDEDGRPREVGHCVRLPATSARAVNTVKTWGDIVARHAAPQSLIAVRGHCHCRRRRRSAACREPGTRRGVHLFPSPILSYSGGKDSCYNMVLCQQYGHEVRCRSPAFGLEPTALLRRCRGCRCGMHPALKLTRHATLISCRPACHPPLHRWWPLPTCCQRRRRRTTWTATCTRRWGIRLGICLGIRWSRH